MEISSSGKRYLLMDSNVLPHFEYAILGKSVKKHDYSDLSIKVAFNLLRKGLPH